MRSGNFAERPLLHPVAELLALHGYTFVACADPPAGFTKGDEFGVALPGPKLKRVDIVGARWHTDGRTLDTVAVECKREGTVRDSVNAALGQATDYQLCVHRVFIATEVGDLQEDKQTVLRALGLGHIIVDMRKSQATFSLQPAPNTRFDLSFHEQLVEPRLLVALTFQEATQPIATGVAYGGLRDGGIWIAKPVAGNLQWNCWWDRKTLTASGGINIEHKSDIRRIVGQVDVHRLDEALKKLPPEYHLRVTKDPVPGRSGSQDQQVLRAQARTVSASALLSKLQDTLPEKALRPHLGIYTQVWGGHEGLTRWERVQRLRNVMDQLGEVMNVLHGQEHSTR